MIIKRKVNYNRHTQSHFDLEIDETQLKEYIDEADGDIDEAVRIYCEENITLEWIEETYGEDRIDWETEFEIVKQDP